MYAKVADRASNVMIYRSNKYNWTAQPLTKPALWTYSRVGNRRSGVLRRVPDVRYLVAGAGTHEEELKAQARAAKGSAPGFWPLPSASGDLKAQVSSWPTTMCLTPSA